MQNSKSYFVLPNTAFGLSSEEFSVLAYLLSIPTAKKACQTADHSREVQYRQSQYCNKSNKQPAFKRIYIYKNPHKTC